MKYSALITIMALALFVFTPDASAQVKINLKEKINREANRRANRKADKGVQKGFDKIEKGVKGIFTKEDSIAAQQQAGTQDVKQGQATAKGNAASATGGKTSAEALRLSWSKYDFVPGDKIIFEDNLIYEENGEFPSRWDLVGGTVENAEFGEDNVIMFRGGSPTIVPYLKNSNIDYLPEVFTVEFDLYLPSNSFTINFYDRKNQQAPRGSTYMSVWHNKMEMNPASSMLPGGKSIANTWSHISIAYTSGKLKAYIDDTRLINIPHLEFDPTGISFHVYHASDNNRSYIKNIRIAEGGVKYYDRFLQDGKIVSNGIRFDVGKASLRPESMGVLNEIYKMLSEHPDVAVSVEGHTDSDGDNDLNQKLSEDRAETVMKQLVSMGLSKDRLSFRGYGESKPVAPNDNPEGKASNRRVEFVKKGSGSNQSNSGPMAAQNMSSVKKKDISSSTQTAKQTGNYSTVTIGNQVWMQENLDVAAFRNGDPIPQAKTEEEWRKANWENQPAWCYYKLDPDNAENYGRLYNWFAINDQRGLAPEGWKIPDDVEWDVLRNYLITGAAGIALKSTEGWKGDGNGVDDWGFNALPSGYRDFDGSFSEEGSVAYWWSSTDNGSKWISCRYLDSGDSLHKHNMPKSAGLSVRCIK